MILTLDCYPVCHACTRELVKNINFVIHIGYSLYLCTFLYTLRLAF